MAVFIGANGTGIGDKIWFMPKTASLWKKPSSSGEKLVPGCVQMIEMISMKESFVSW